MMRTYTVTGLVDEQDGTLYVAATIPGRHSPAGDAAVTYLEGYGDMTRFTGSFDAESPAEAERLARDIAAQVADDTASRWATSNGTDSDMA